MTPQIQTKVSDWRAKFTLSALETFREMISDPEMKAVFTGPEMVVTYTKFALSDGKAEAPFYWKEWNCGEKQLVQCASSNGSVPSKPRSSSHRVASKENSSWDLSRSLPHHGALFRSGC